MVLERVHRPAGIFSAHHLHESIITGPADVSVAWNRALLDSAVLLEKHSEPFLGQIWVDTGDEELGALVERAARLFALKLLWWWGRRAVL